MGDFVVISPPKNMSETNLDVLPKSSDSFHKCWAGSFSLGGSLYYVDIEVVWEDTRSRHHPLGLFSDLKKKNQPVTSAESGAFQIWSSIR